MSVIESKQSKLTTVPLQSLAQGSMFWQPDHIEPSAWLDHLPWVFWLMETMQPKRCVTLGARPGSPHLALCQAAKRIDVETECLLISRQDEAQDIAAQAERRYAACHRLVAASPLRAAKRVTSGIDIVAVDLVSDDEDMDIALEPLLGLMSEQGVVLIPGINGGDTSHGAHTVFADLQTRYPSLSFHHGGGLGVVVVGAKPSALLETLLTRWKTASAAQAVRDVFARLGRGIADQAVGEQHKRRLGYVKERLEEVTRERDVEGGRANELQQTLDEQVRAVLTLEKENRHLDEKLADAQGRTQALDEELSQTRSQLANVQTALSVSQSENQALQSELAQKNANISDLDQKLVEAQERTQALDEELSNARSQLSESQAALSFSQSENQTLKSELSEKDVNINTRFNELAILTNMLEEADKKSERWERKATQYFDLNEEKKVEAKEFRRQIAKAQAADSDQRALIDKLRDSAEALQERVGNLEESVNASEMAYSNAVAKLAEAQAALSVSQSENQTLKNELTEKDANINTRFNELAILTNMLEEADKKSERWERKATQYFDLNEEKKVEAKQLRRQIAKAQAVDSDQRVLIDKQKRSLDARFKELGALTASMEAKEAELVALKTQHEDHGVGKKRSSLVLSAKEIGPGIPKRLGKRAEQRKLQNAIAELEASEWFDGQWYLQQNPDIASDEKYQRCPALHYLKFGGFEGRNPSPHFESAYYLATHDDVAESGINPLVHYIKFGEKEKRSIREW